MVRISGTILCMGGESFLKYLIGPYNSESGRLVRIQGGLNRVASESILTTWMCGIWIGVK